MAFLGTYEKEFDQLISKKKRCYILGDKTDSARCHIIEEVTSFQKRNLPIKYLGWSLFIGRKKIVYFDDVLKKFEKKVGRLEG